MGFAFVSTPTFLGARYTTAFMVSVSLSWGLVAVWDTSFLPIMESATLVTACRPAMVTDATRLHSDNKKQTPRTGTREDVNCPASVCT